MDIIFFTVVVKAYIKLFLSGLFIPFILGFMFSNMIMSLSRKQKIGLNFFIVVCYFIAIKIILSDNWSAWALFKVLGLPFALFPPERILLFLLIPYFLGMRFSLRKEEQRKNGRPKK